MSLNYRKIGKRIQEARTLREMSIADLADRVHFTPKSIIYVENGTAALTLELLTAICTVLNITPNDLLEGEYTATSSRSLEEEVTLRQLKDLVNELKGEAGAWDEDDIVIRDTATVVKEIRDMVREEKRNPVAAKEAATKKSTHW